MAIRRVPAHPDQGRVIRAARLERGISLTRLAELLTVWMWRHGVRRRRPVSRRYVVRLQAGQRCPSGRMAAGLSQVLGVTLPMPAIDPMLTAQGRRAAAERERARQRELARQPSLPRLESYYPAHLIKWN